MRILLIEDDQLIGNGLQIGLSKTGFLVDWFRDGENGLNALVSAPYDAVVLDLTLPKLDGLDVLKQCPQGSQVKVILTKSNVIVEDNGVSPEDLAKLGQPFYRPAGQNEKGSGLGLSIVARIAELHNYGFKLENIEINGKAKGLRAIIEL